MADCKECYCESNEPINIAQSPSMKYFIRVEQLDKGYIVNVGCKTFAFEDKEKMIEYVIGYIDNPSYMIKRYLEGKMEFNGETADFVNVDEQEETKSK